MLNKKKRKKKLARLFHYPQTAVLKFYFTRNVAKREVCQIVFEKAEKAGGKYWFGDVKEKQPLY